MIFFKRIISLVLAGVLLFQQIAPSAAQAVPLGRESKVVQPYFLNLSEKFDPVTVRGLSLSSADPMAMDFIVDLGGQSFDKDLLTGDVRQLTEYFLAALAVPEKDLWVNLSPYEQDRVIPESFGRTRMGYALLAQDKLLKQMVSSLMSPDTPTGKDFWARVHREIPDYDAESRGVDTFHKVWVVPDRAVVEENETAVMIKDSHLKVMLEKDYFAATKNQELSSKAARSDSIEAAIIDRTMRAIILPVLEEEINSGKIFAPLRQIFQAAILAVWYKQAAQESVLGRIYVDQNRVSGIGDILHKDIEAVFAQYAQVFKEGVFNVIREEEDSITGDLVPRHYFSGGCRLSITPVLEHSKIKGSLDFSQKSKQRGALVLAAFRIRLLGGLPSVYSMFWYPVRLSLCLVVLLMFGELIEQMWLPLPVFFYGARLCMIRLDSSRVL